MVSILIADSGSTKTDWLLVRADGSVISELGSQGINPFFQDERTIASLMEKEVFPQVAREPDAVFFYGAGCASPEAGAPVAETLQRRFPSARISVESDLLGAARALCGRSPGIACILGTGSNNCLYDGEKITGNIGSLGFWMGDEGSGGHLGKQLVVAYLHRELPADLMSAFALKYPEVNRLEILDRAYRKPFPNRYFAGYARFAGEHRDSAFIRSLVKGSFGAFLDKYVLKHPGAGEHPVFFVGSVAWHFKDLLANAVEEKGLKLGTVAGRPMPGLKLFHTSGS